MNTDNLATQMVSDDLGFEGMPLLFAAVEAFLVFLGRSQGVSVASTKTSSYLDSSPLKVRLLGKVYFPEAIKVSSTLTMMRWTVGSLTR